MASQRAVLPPPFSFSSRRSLIHKWLPLHPKLLVASLDPKECAVTERNANFLMILAQRLERELHHSRPDRMYRLRPPLPHPELEREGLETPLRKTFATSTGTPDSATVGLTVRLDTRKTPTRGLAIPKLLEVPMKKTLQTQH